MTSYRLFRTLAFGLILGITLAVSYVALAQEGFSYPVFQAVQILAKVGNFSLVSPQLPDDEVFLPQVIDEGSAYEIMEYVLSLHGFCAVRLHSGVVIITQDCPNRHGGSDDVPDHSGNSGHVDDVHIVEIPILAPESIRPVRLRLGFVDVDTTSSESIGINWSEIFTTANLLRTNLDVVLAGFIGSPQLDNIISALQQRGIATRADEVELVTVSGEAVTFNRGGSINVNLVGAQGATIQQSYNVGLTLSLLPTQTPDGIMLRYQYSDTSPSNVSDPANIQLASTSNSGVMLTQCGATELLAVLNNDRVSMSGQGLPGAIDAPVIGYLGARSSNVSRYSTLVVTVGVYCEL